MTWNWLLSQWGWLAYCNALATALHVVASIGAFAALGYSMLAAFSGDDSERSLRRLAEEVLQQSPETIESRTATLGGASYGAPPTTSGDSTSLRSSSAHR